MLQRRHYFAVVVALTLTAPAFSQDVELAWKFKKGDKFFQEMNTKTMQNMKIMGMDVKQEQEQTFLFSWNVLDAEEGKQTVIEQKIEAVKINIRLGGTDIRFDSTQKDAEGTQLASFFRPLVGTSFKLTLDPKMKITKVEGREEFLKKLGDANPAMKPLLQIVLSEEQLRQLSEPAFSVVKGKGEKVKANDTWTWPADGKTNKLSLGPIGSYDTKYTYTYQGKEKKSFPEVNEGKEMELHKIGMKTDLTYVPPDPKEASKEAANLNFKVEGGSLKATTTEGTIWFDADKGRVIRAEMKVVLEGKLTISVMQQNAEVEFNQTQTTTTRTLDKNPYEPAK